MPVYKDKERGTWFIKCYYTNWDGEKKQKKKQIPQKKIIIDKIKNSKKIKYKQIIPPKIQLNTKNA